MLILVINSGSSSLKFQLVDVAVGRAVTKGTIEEITDYASALEQVFNQVSAAGYVLSQIHAVGHRVVHGGARFSQPTLIDENVINEIESLVPLAPLHNPPALLGIRAVAKLHPELRQVAVFDTAFHATIPEVAYRYAIPNAIANEFGIRRYGFHGSSHQFITNRTAELLSIPVEDVNLIICHIGNGSSVTAIRNGRSIDTSMGMTPLEGLMMGTRSGDVDPGVLFHLARVADMSIEQLDVLLNRQSGLLGIAGKSDMREVEEAASAGDPSAKLARAMYAYKLQKYIAAYAGLLPQLHALVFTAGVGENDSGFRSEVVRPLTHLGFSLDEGRNNSSDRSDRLISTASSPIAVLVVGTNEELEIARQTAALTK